LRKGNLIFLKTHLVDLIYVVKEIKEDRVIAKKLDAPPELWEALPLDKVVRLAEEQEKLLPSDIGKAIEEQRLVVFTPPRQSKKKRSLDKMMKSLPKEAIEEILDALAQAGITEKEGGE
jgi:hypothetical protein